MLLRHQSIVSILGIKKRSDEFQSVGCKTCAMGAGDTPSSVRRTYFGAIKIKLKNRLILRVGRTPGLAGSQGM